MTLCVYGFMYGLRFVPATVCGVIIEGLKPDSALVWLSAWLNHGVVEPTLFCSALMSCVMPAGMSATRWPG